RTYTTYRAYKTHKSYRPLTSLQDEFAQVLLLQDVRQSVAYVRSVDHDALVRQIRSLETDVLYHPFQDRVQAAGAHLLRPSIHLVSHVRQGLDAVAAELQPEALRRQEFGVLLGQGVLGLGEDAQEVLALQVGQFHADRKAAL